jgi:hypothetical protein
MKKLILSLSILAFLGCKKEQMLEPTNVEQITTNVQSFRTYSSPAQALFDKWDSLGCSASEQDKIKYSESIDYLISKGVWDSLDCIFKFDVHNKTAALVDWKNPQRMATIVGDYAGSFIAYKGFDGNGTTFKINTNYNPYNSTLYTLNNCMKGVYINSNETTARVDMSSESATNNGLNVFLQNNNTPKSIIASTNNAGDLNYTPILQAYGWHVSTRGNANEYESLKNGVSITKLPKAKASTSIQNQNVYLFCRNVNGTFSAYSNKIISGAFFGAKCNQLEVINGLNIWGRYAGSVPNKLLMIDGNSLTKAAHWVDRMLRNYGSSNYVNEVCQAKVGIRTNEMYYAFPNTLGLVKSDIYSKKILVVWELTNDIYLNGQNVDSAYAHIVEYCNQAKTIHGNDLIILVGTCLPRDFLTPSVRQDLNQRIRNNYTSFATDIIDVGNDSIVGVDSYGVNGVGERNTTYYGSDKTHMTITGYNYVSDNYFYPKINQYLQ